MDLSMHLSMQNEIFNSHPRDQCIEFDEPTHTYSINGSSKGVTSATTFIHHFFEPFDATKVISKMMENKKKFSEGIYKDMTAQQIKDKWSGDGKEASQLGTEMHKSIELFYKTNDKPPPEEVVSKETPKETPKEFEFFLEFHTKVVIGNGWVPYRSEWSIYIEELKLAGQLDMLYRKADGSFVLCDWKRSKSIVVDNPYQKGKEPLTHLPDCNYIHYHIQLNLYKYILEKYYDLVITEMYLVILHPNQETYKQIPVRVMKDEIEKILETRRQELHLL